MATDPVSGGSILSTFKEHPYLWGGLAVGVFVVVYLYASSGSTSTAASTGGTTTDDTATTDAAAIQAAQVSANQAIALGAQTAGVTNNETAAATTLGLAQIQANNGATAAASTATLGSAYYNAMSEISASNASTAAASLQAGATEQIGNDQVVSNEFSDLASTLVSYGNNYQAIILGSPTNSAAPASASGPQTYTVAPDINYDSSQSSSSSIAQTVRGWFGKRGSTGSSSSSSSSAYSYSTAQPTAAQQNAQGGVGAVLGLQPAITANLTGFNTLAGLFGSGLQAPVGLSDTALESLAAINLGAVNSNFNVA